MAVSTLLCNLPTYSLPNGTVLDSLSSVVDSRFFGSQFWAIEDNDTTASPNAYIYAMNYDGTLRKVIRLIGISASGPPLYGAWTDMCYDEFNTLMWVANAGNPGHSSDTFWAFSFFEPFTLGSSGSVLDVSINGQYLFQWPDNGANGWDCETIMCDSTGRLYFVTKENSTNSGLYQAPASLAAPPSVNTLTKVASWTDVEYITGGDWASDDSSIFLTSQSDATLGDVIYKYNPIDYSYLGSQQVPDASSGGGGAGVETALGFTYGNLSLLRGSAGSGADIWQIDPFSSPTPITYTWYSSSTQVLTPRTHP